MNFLSFLLSVTILIKIFGHHISSEIYFQENSLVDGIFSDRVQEMVAVGEDELEADRILEDFQDQQDQVHLR